jgi:hypothetical protein
MTRAVDGFATRPDFVDEARVIFLAPRQHREHFFARLLEIAGLRPKAIRRIPRRADSITANFRG